MSPRRRGSVADSTTLDPVSTPAGCDVIRPGLERSVKMAFKISNLSWPGVQTSVCVVATKKPPGDQVFSDSMVATSWAP